MKTGEVLKKFRLESGLSQLELELALNLASGTVSRIENNHTNPTKETLLKIANYLKLDFTKTSELMGLEARVDNSLFKRYIERYKSTLLTIFGNSDINIEEFSYSEGFLTFIDKCTQTLYKSKNEVMFIGDHDLFRKYYPENIDKEYYIKPRVKNNLPAKIIAAKNNKSLNLDLNQDYLREVRLINNLNIDLMVNINESSVVLMCLNNKPSILEIFDNHLVEIAKKRFYQMWISMT